MGGGASQEAKTEEPEIGIAIDLSPELQELMLESDKPLVTEEVKEQTQKRRIGEVQLQVYLPSPEEICVDIGAQERLATFSQESDKAFSQLRSKLDEAVKLSRANEEDIKKVKEESAKPPQRCQVQQDLLAKCKRDTPLLCSDYLDRYLSCVNSEGPKKE